MRMLGSQDITLLMECGNTMNDIKSMSDQEIETILNSVQGHDDEKVRQAEQNYSIWGLSPAF